MRLVLAALLLCVSCTSPSAMAETASATSSSSSQPLQEGYPEGSLRLAGNSTDQQDLGDGRTAYLYEIVFLGDRLSKAPGVVSLQLRGVHVAPGSEAEVYLAHPSGNDFGPSNYIGSVGTVAGGPSLIPQVTLEISDFEADGTKYTARSTLRDMPYFSVALVVTSGSVTVDELVLSAR